MKINQEIQDQVHCNEVAAMDERMTFKKCNQMIHFFLEKFSFCGST